MLNNKYRVTAGIILFTVFCHHTSASPSSPASHQTEQDRAREAALTPQQQKYISSQVDSDAEKIVFPKEKNCKIIEEVHISSEDNRLTQKLLGKLTRQAKFQCLGIEGIRLFSRALQNELIVRGYITSLIDIPSQSLEKGVLYLTLTYGKIGEIAFAKDEPVNKTSLWNNLPFARGDILRLPDLEQGMANLQRLPGSSAHMRLLPGQYYAETDVRLTRKLGKPWQLGAWLDDAGSRTSGRYQGGGALYLYDMASLNDIFYVAAGGDVEFNRHEKGNENSSLYYSVPFGYWNISLYATRSQYLQQFRGRWSSTDYESKNRYYSATLSRLLAQTRTHKTSLDAKIFKSTSRYYFGGSELGVMRKQNPGWDLTLRHQHYFASKIVDVSVGIQNRLPWLSSTATPEEKAGLFDNESRVVHADIEAYMKFAVTGDKFTWAPKLSAQFSPDELSSDNQFNIGNRWTVRGFDGEQSLSANQGWYWRNDLIWDIHPSGHQFYTGADIGRLTGSEKYKQGKVLAGTVAGLRGELYATQYDLFIGTPLYKPAGFHSQPLNMGFSLQWRY
ncbi:ShlB/FhaC/HecB family hemolysin secretion/activation protein [Leclercia adecarboxylata]|uniref:ShlB/FhaC/HecB family hemolysin secretion/activation protein n=1 Tax=Leclercia adecarboxylata TaxID=83655 RepID=UPI002DBE2F0F|nr:ShlB/FhaC/HecB family hemolysin secretion/activation protein [Leclercia adecarboxylata]MEB6379361.1 ShlB/FhaC/HecB family hemolysin secretion/activation protein [Leclercia adecarboxylata]